ncbi:MobF family relaxase [Embleya sp. MST-111070]|uniref:MobF family relaxase n=1 Tax=Embleya sp. MST-111070 TaxID=3398231 RepID=UPI003F73AA34
MLTISAGSDHRYLTDQVGRGAEHYYLKAIEVAGEPPGVWLGAGAAAFGLRGEVDAEVMERLYGDLVDPVSGAALGAAPRRYRTVEQRLADALAALPDEATPEERAAVVARVQATQVRAVKYLDLTFSAPKSWSVFHAALQADGRYEEAQAVWDAWMAGVRAGIDHLQEHAGFSRAGHNGVRRVDAHEWTVAAFRQHTSRDEEPQLHVHCAVLNRVRSVEVHPYTGQRIERWRTLDGRAVYAQRPAAAALAERVAEEALTRALGVRFALRPDGRAREIVGVGAELRERFSSRRRAISAKVEEMVALYRAVHGRSPSAYELTCLAQTATLHTRAPKKKHAVPREELLARWERVVTSTLRESLAGVARRVLDAGAEPVSEPAFDPDRVVAKAIGQLTLTRPTFRRAELVAELNRQLPDGLGGLSPDGIRGLLDELVARALSPAAGSGGATVVRLAAPDPAAGVPAALSLSDGASRYARPEATLYTTIEQLDVEASIIAYAARRQAPCVRTELVEGFLAGGALGSDQAAAVRDLATAGRFVDVLVGPAGTGKSYTIAGLCALWEAGGGTVKGLAVGQRQARVMADEGVSRVANVRRFLIANAAIAAGESVPDRELYSFHAGELVIVDEAGTCSTADLASILSLAADAGAKVVLAGDHGQTAEIGAGGMFGLLARDLPHAHVLEEVRRFRDGWERAASLRLREGDAEVFAEYDLRGRAHGGGVEEMKDAAYRAWLADHLSGVDALLVVPTRESAAELSGRARAHLVRLGRVEHEGVALADGNVAGRGDRVQLRRNDPSLTSSGRGHWATNRDVVRVLARHGDGGLTVAYEDGETLRVPARYVRDHVELAYAGTVHAVQGRTVDAAHALVTTGMTREQLYVALTRARLANHVYLAASGGEAAHPRGVFAAVLGRTEAQRSATEALREAFADAESLRTRVPVWSDLMEQRAAAGCLDVVRAELGAEGGDRVEEEAAFGALTRLMRRVEDAGYDAHGMLRRVIRERRLADADSVAEVLHWRVERELARVAEATGGRGLSGARSGYAARSPSVSESDAVGVHLRELAAAMDRRVVELGHQAADSPPGWLVERLGAVPVDPGAREEWVRRAGLVANYREAYGYTHRGDAIGPAPAVDAVDARHAWDRAAEALGATGETHRFAVASTAELQRCLDRYEREERWAPPHVTDRLRASAGEQARWRRARAEALMRSWTAVSPEESAAAKRAAESAESRYAVAESEARVLESIHATRAAWYTHTAEAREQARAARVELDRRERVAAASGGARSSWLRRFGGGRFDPVPASRWRKPKEVAPGAPPPVRPETGPVVPAGDVSGAAAEPMSLEEAAARAARARAIIDGRRRVVPDPTAAGFTAVVAIHPQEPPVVDALPGPDSTAGRAPRDRGVERDPG